MKMIHQPQIDESHSHSNFSLLHNLLRLWSGVTGKTAANVRSKFMRCQYKKIVSCPSESHNDEASQKSLGYSLCNHHERVVLVRILGKVFSKDEEIGEWKQS